MMHVVKYNKNTVSGELDALGLKHGTDKASSHHDYLNKYERYLPFNRSDKIRILEVGVCYGGSVKTWAEYYPNSEVVGIDIAPHCKNYEKDNIKIEIGSQNDASFLAEIRNKYGQFDMILDDATHQSPDQIFTFKEMFQSVVSHGLYIVEDASTSYWPEFQGGTNRPDTCMEYFKSLVDEVNFHGVLAKPPYYHHRRDDKILINQEIADGKDYMGLQIESVNFLNSIVIVVKR